MKTKVSRTHGILHEARNIDRRKMVLGLGAAGAAVAAPSILTPGSAQAAGWPDRTINAVIMYSAGGGTDTVIRALAEEIARTTGWTINPLNKPGAVGGVATGFVQKKPSDGYWWLGAANYNKFVRVMGQSISVPWEDWQYFQAANSIASWSVRADSPYKSLQDVIDDAKSNPGRISISTSGTGGLWQELALIVSEAAGISLKYVPYKGGKPAVLAGIQGEVDIAGGGVNEHIEFIKAGTMRNLHQTSADDIVIPNVGTLLSAGNIIPDLKPLLPLGGVYNIALRRDAPTEILEEIKTVFTAAANSDSFRQVAKAKYFNIDVRTGEAADKRAAQLETLTATTFYKVRDQIGKRVKSPEELGLPDPKEFEAWWPPRGYKPRMT